ncbi:MarR family winged helix-turn-helix transcriptional regulator [Actinacidiphila rubida]|uniref:DNA-binding transcriptional regulator, MarR family n=1 Tax=Actinacidiphila rubida TaxID=310780 RepID=A0A1H8GFH2_9ACTN|nr:MarR family winged helix-turn-helix transcriptional regulator [Actinacidiphila rubida]SEN42494.1 DNA-binding transcriptional regulator, MarR family [Actinacidiphila rubida]
MTAQTVPASPVGTPDLSYLMQHTAHVLSTQMTAALAEIGMSPRAHCVLAHALQAERTQAQIAELSDLDKTTMVVTVDMLERNGLAERVPSATDRRARIIKVTPKGQEIVAAGQGIVDRVHRDLLGALPDDERAVFVSALNRLATGHCAVPAESPEGAQGVRRPRQSRK